MTVVQSPSGLRLDFLRPDPEAIDIADIAWSLAHICRWTGGVKKFYSVAEHSVLVADHVPDVIAMDGLLHDATEAYMSDIPAPLKEICPFYADTEKKLRKVIANKFGTAHKIPHDVRIADRRMMEQEFRDVVPVDTRPEHQKSVVAPLDANIQFLKPDDAYDLFMKTFRGLGKLR